MKERDKRTVGRRDFLRVMAVGASAAAAGAVPLVGSAAAAESDQEKKKPRYKETDHVKAFYRVNRYPK